MTHDETSSNLEEEKMRYDADMVRGCVLNAASGLRRRKAGKLRDLIGTPGGAELIASALNQGEIAVDVPDTGRPFIDLITAFFQNLDVILEKLQQIIDFLNDNFPSTAE